MELKQFDDLTRQLGQAGSSRRPVLRALGGALLGGALSGLATRLGLADVTAAKPKKTKRKSRTERKRRGQLQAEGKRHKKHGKKNDRRPKNPPSPECDELTVPLCNRCEEAVCAAGDWVCSSNGKKECPDGSCVAANACCDGKYRCDDGTCVDPFEECCPGQKDCGGGLCLAEDACCPGQKKCPGYTECFAAEDCCPNALPPLCDECDKVVCEHGDLVCRPKTNCCPTGQKQCGDECIPEAQCCELTSPLCQQGEQPVCCQGEQVCRYSFDEPSCAGLEWLAYNPAICRCECPEGTHQTGGYCCPSDHPWFDGYGYCCRYGTCDDAVCAIGFSRDGNGPCRRTT